MLMINSFSHFSIFFQVSCLGSVGGHNGSICARIIMVLLLTKNLAVKFNMKGKETPQFKFLIFQKKLKNYGHCSPRLFSTIA